jgi:hypothetical protein
MFTKARVLAFILFCPLLLTAQVVPDKTTSEATEKLRKEAVAFLRETVADVNAMRSLENRISFTAEMAGLMWFHDEREARAMYSGAIGDYRDLLARYDAQMNSLGITAEDAATTSRFPSFMVEPTDKSRVLRKFSTAIGVGQQIAMSLAEHDAELAYTFYYDSIAAISNPEFRKQTENRDTYFESQLLTQIAEDNAAKAAQLGARSVAKGLNYYHLELLKKIHAKDPARAAEFASAILGRVKVEKVDNSDFYLISSLLEFGGQTYEASRKPGGKKAIYSLAELRDLAEFLAQAILSRSESDVGGGVGYIDLIQKYAPGRAAQIRAKFRRSMSSLNSVANRVANAANAAANGMSSEYSNSNSNSGRYEQEMREREERDKAERKLIEDVQSLGTKQLPKEERERIIAQSRKIIMQTPGRDQKIMSLSMLAAQVAKMGDKELASEIMRDAETFVNPAPKNYHDFLLTWMLASGYAAADPDKAFPLLEETIGRANDTLAAFIKVGEFIDVAEEMIQDGEVQVGGFGGQMVRGLTRELGVADATIQVLAKADFAKTRNLTNRFDRPEVRVLAKMMVLRAVLDEKKKAPAEDEFGPPPNK